MDELDSIGAAGESRRRHSVQKTLVVAKNVGFCNAKLKVEDIEVFTLYAANVTFAKNTSAKCPMDILECGIIQILQERYERLKRKGEVGPMCSPWKLR